MDDPALRATAKHEVLHGLFALSCATIHRVSCMSAQAEVTFHAAPGSLLRLYRADPLRTQRTVTAIAASLLAPAVVMGEPVVGNDALWLELYEEGWQKVRQGPKAVSWFSLIIDAREFVSKWYHHTPGARLWVERIASYLMPVGQVYGDQRGRKVVMNCQPPSVRVAVPQISAPVVSAPVASASRVAAPSPRASESGTANR